MTVADYIAAFLEAQGVTHVFTLAGGMIAPMLDALHLRGGLAPNPAGRAPLIIPCRHEQAAGFAAEGMARMTGIPGVAMATSGPGATNLLTAIASCYFDSTPCVFITGQVPLHEMRRGGERQRGFQETDIVAMARPATKRAYQITDPRQIPMAIRDAFGEAIEGRPGPVLLDIPFNVQRASAEGFLKIEGAIGVIRPDPKIDLAPIFSSLRGAKRPLVLVGGGAASFHNRASVRKLLDYLSLPVVHSLLGKDVFPHYRSIGMIGSYGNRWANKALAECDFLLVLGSRLDIRQIGSKPQEAMAGKVLWHVDVDPSETGKDWVPVGYRPIACDLRDFCRAVIDSPHPVILDQDPAPWLRTIAGWQADWPAESELQVPEGAIHPLKFLASLGEAAIQANASAIVTDVGSHQMWAAQCMPVSPSMRFITSGGHGAMGFGLPAAIGVALADPSRPVVLVTGDASLMVNVQELATLQELNLPVKIVVMDNGGHGMVREFQDRLFEGRHAATEQAGADLVEVARAFGLSSSRAARAPLGWMFRAERPCLLHVPIDPRTPVAPRLPYGGRLDAMDPPR